MTAERYKLPKGWVWTKLRTICKINPKHPKDIVSANAPVSFVPMSSIDAEKGGIIDSQTRPFGKVRKGHTHFANGDVLFAKITPCMENGKAAIAKGLHNGVGCGTTELHILRPLESILSELIFYYIRQINFRKRAEANMSGTAGHLRVPVDFIGESDFPLSPLPEQKRIVQKIEILLGHLNKTRQELAKIPPLIKKFRQSILAKAFTGELTKEWRDQQESLESASALLARIRGERKQKLGKKHREPEPIDTSDFLDLPKGWVWVRLGEVCFFEYGEGLPKTKRIKGEIPVYGSNGIVGYHNKHHIKGPAIIIGRKGSFGKVNIVESDCWPIDTTYYITRDSVSLDFLFLYFVLVNLRLDKYDRSTAIPGLNREEAHSKVLALPPVQEQAEIVKGIIKFYRRTDTIKKSVKIAQTHCEKLSQSILNKAFRGQLVEQNPDDEPASILLEKIRSEKGRMSKQKRLGSDA